MLAASKSMTVEIDHFIICGKLKGLGISAVYAPLHVLPEDQIK